MKQDALLLVNKTGKSRPFKNLSGKDAMPEIVKAAMDSAQANAQKTSKTTYEQVCADAQSAYAARNPHTKKEDK